MRIFRSRSNTEKGQSMVELAISLVVLLLILNGIVDLGGLLYSYVSLRDSAQEGIVYGSYNPNDTTSIKSRIRNSAGFPLDSTTITDGNIHIYCCLNSVTGPCTSACSTTSTASCPGQKFTVRVDYTYNLSMPFISPLLGGNTTIPMQVVSTSTIIESAATVAALRSLGTTCP
jgi:hypothetical protein